jgi:hypothetical protein
MRARSKEDAIMAATSVFPTWPWTPSLAPDWLEQRFNNGWTFGNVYVTTQNSSAPDVEKAVVSEHSYGQQLGRLTDAVVELARLLKATHNADVQPLVDLAEDIARIKQRTQRTRSAELLDELRALKKNDPKAFAELVKSA